MQDTDETTKAMALATIIALVLIGSTVLLYDRRGMPLWPVDVTREYGLVQFLAQLPLVLIMAGGGSGQRVACCISVALSIPVAAVALWRLWQCPACTSAIVDLWSFGVAVSLMMIVVCQRLATALTVKQGQ